MRGRRRPLLAVCFLLLAATAVIAAPSPIDVHARGRSLAARVNFQEKGNTNDIQDGDGDKDYYTVVDGGDDGDGDGQEDDEEDQGNMQQDILNLEKALTKSSYQFELDDDLDGEEEEGDAELWRRQGSNDKVGGNEPAIHPPPDSKTIDESNIDKDGAGRNVKEEDNNSAGSEFLQNGQGGGINGAGATIKAGNEPGKTVPSQNKQQPTAQAAAARAAAAKGAAKGVRTNLASPSPPPPSPNPFNLPSFDATPLPPKRTFAQWQAGYQDARRAATREHFGRVRGIIAGKLHPSQSSPNSYEFTSRIALNPEGPPPGYAAACLVVRDAHDDLAEWVHYHLKLNFSKIYIYDHASMPPLINVVRRWVDAGSVVYERFDQFYHPSGRPQLYGYDKCLREHSRDHHWLAFFDVDEYLLFQSGPPVQDLPNLLKKYESYSGLAVHWILFGSSGKEYRPAEGTLKSYTRCLPLNHTHHLYVKTIANTRCTVRSSDNPHVFIHNCTRPAVRTDFSPARGQTAEGLPVHDVLALHHYAIRSAEEFEIKMARGSGMKRQRGWDYFYFVDNWSVEYCLAGLQVWDDDVITLSRTIDPGSLQLQLDKYATEEHEDFWGAKAKAAAKAAQAAAAGAIAKQAQAQQQAQGDHWGKDTGEVAELDEHGGELDIESDDDYLQQRR